MERWKKITLSSVVGATILIASSVYFRSSDARVFRSCVISRIPASVRDLKSAQTGLAQDWSASFYFHASLEDTDEILRAVGFRGPAASQEYRTNFIAQWQSVYTGMGCPSPASRPSSAFYFHQHGRGLDYALVSTETQEVFLTKWESY